MEKKNTAEGASASPLWATLETFARQEIQAFIQRLLEQEVTDLLGRGRSCRRAVVAPTPGYRNGYGKPRRLTLSNGTITLQRPRVRGLEERFVSRVLPLFQRRTREVGAVLPELYLHGLAQGDFTLALRGLLGEGAPLSASSIARLTAGWAAEYHAWRQRPLADLEVVYLWADGLYVKAGVEDTKAALLVVIGALSDGRKLVLAVEPGQRESTTAWAEVLRSLRARGLTAPRLTVADGHLGLWAALAQVFPESAEQRGWNHRIVNILDAVPLKHQAEIRTALRAIAYAPTRGAAERLRAHVAKQGRARFPQAVERLEHDWDRLVAYDDFPHEHWRHLRTTNVIESPFDAVRLRTTAAKRFKKVETGSAMIWKLLLLAEQRFRRLNAPELLPAVDAGVKYVDGMPAKSKPGRLAA